MSSITGWSRLVKRPAASALPTRIDSALLVTDSTGCSASGARLLRDAYEGVRPA